MKTIILTGGGTAGHCTPHFAVIPYLEEHFDQIIYVGSKNGIEKTLTKNYGLPYYEIPTVKLDRSKRLSNLKIPFILLKSISESKKILKEVNPSVVFSKGGYVGLPVTIASHQLKIPTVIHESDLTIGLANKIASNFSDITLTSFEKTASAIKNGRCVGSPIRDELFSVSKSQALRYYGITGEKPTLLITGGSSGAKFINDLTIFCLDELLKTFNVLHLVGKGNLTNTKIHGYYQIEFTDMKYAYNATDICISRAGSNTAFELIALKIPTLFIPLPKGASRGDQIDNAKYFSNLNLCKFCLQENLTPSTFIQQIYELYASKDKLKESLNEQNISSGNKIIAKILSTY